MQKIEIYQEAQAPNGIFYRLYGAENSATPLTMVMGYGGCMFAWPLEFIQALAKHFPVLILDNRGTGRSARLEENIELRMQHFAEDLKGLLAHLSFSKTHLFGYSMGGCISLEFAQRYPEQVERMILQSTTAGGPLYTGADPEVKERLANPRGSNFDEMLFDFFDLCMPAQALEKHRELLNNICANARPYPTSPKVLQAQLNAFRKFDASLFVEKLPHKALLFHGREDRILKVQNGEKLSQSLRDCRSQFFENCGHSPHIEQQTIVLQQITDFCSSN